LSVDQFLDRVAEGTPTPGGGTVSAMVGALAAALAIMVANLTLGRKKFSAAEGPMRETKQRAQEIRELLGRLAQQDSEAFEAVLRARRMAEQPDEAARSRASALATAELEATRVPLRTAEACLEIIELAARVARHGNPNAVTDAGVAGRLAAAAAEGALLNVQINLKSLPATADKDDIEKALRRLSAAMTVAARDCDEVVQAILTA